MNLYLNSSIGILEVVTGSMFSGKSAELIRRLIRSQYSKQLVIVFKYSFDTRNGEARGGAHSKDIIDAFPSGSV